VGTALVQQQNSIAMPIGRRKIVQRHHNGAIQDVSQCRQRSLPLVTGEPVRRPIREPSRSGVSPPWAAAIRNTSAAAAKAPAIAPPDSAHTPAPANSPEAMTAAAPTSAPQDTPSTEEV
jgi:hypothetical protein